VLEIGRCKSRLQWLVGSLHVSSIATEFTGSSSNKSDTVVATAVVRLLVIRCRLLPGCCRGPFQGQLNTMPQFL
jgi:hypothetical protein